MVLRRNMNNKYDYNKHYTIRELCELLNIKYNEKNPKLSLNKIKYELELEQITKQKYRIIRELSIEEKTELLHFSQCKQILEPTIYYMLSKAKDYKIRDDMQGYFKRFHITNEYYKYFSYDNLTEKKIELLEKLNFGEEMKETNLIFHHFVTDTNPIFRRIVLSVFDKMVDESYIIKKDHLMFGVEKYINVGANDNGDVIQKCINNNNEATNEEERTFVTIRREKMEALNYNELSKVPYPIRKQIEQAVLKEMGKKYMYYEYEIILNTEGLQRKSEEQNLEELFNQLNISIAEKIKRSKAGGLKDTSSTIKQQCIDNLIT